MEPVGKSAGYSALIVDDNFYNRDIFKIALEFAGYSVAAADNGEIGISMLGRQTYNLLILDLQMPVIDGREVLRSVKQMPKHKTMNIIVVTANAHMATDDVSDLADFVMYKPINVAEFTDFVRRLKDRQSPVLAD
jgi:CheY-like chemotaxis protein